MKTRSDTFQFEKELDWEKPAPGIRRQIMGYDGQLMMVKVEFEKGAVGSMHQHYHSQATYVASGKFELTAMRKSRAPTTVQPVRATCSSKGRLPKSGASASSSMRSAIPSYSPLRQTARFLRSGLNAAAS